MFQPGTLIDKYRISHQLGDGGMGAVFAAEHVVLRRPAAIKVLHPHVAQRPELVQRFVNEAMAAAALNHRNIIGVLDCGQVNGQWYIALDFLSGRSLEGEIRARGGAPFDLATILHVLGEASNGLHAAHERGFVHRDVKPDNLFITQTEDDPLRVIVLDFGIAKLGEHAHGVATQSNVIMGTPAYMAPEQLHDTKDVDRRADVFALGVIAYEMVTARRPWGDATSAYAIIEQRARIRAAPNPRAIDGRLPKKWADVVARAMEPDRDRRWPTAKHFALALAEATPVPSHSRGGLAILERYAAELTRAPKESETVGTRVPTELQQPVPVGTPTAPLGPVAAAPSVSDGVPRAPASSPGALGPSGSISTISSSSGQVSASPQRASSRRFVLGAALAGVAAAGVVVAFAVTRRDGPDEPRAAAPPAIAADASVDVSIDAAPRTSALAIVTEPAGAQVTIDGDGKGAAPLNLPLLVGHEVMIRAEMTGHAPAEQRVTVGEQPATVRLVLAPLVDAAPPQVTTEKPRERRRKPRRGTDRTSGEPTSGDKSGEGFSFDDVGGD